MRDVKHLIDGMPSKDLLNIVDKSLCENSLAFFIRDFWDVVEPATPLVWGWVLDAMCEHLEAVTNGEIKRLIINVCPGFMKSLLVCVFWPAWEWGPRGMPHLRYIATSYTKSLTERDNLRFLRLVRSEKYQKRWGEQVKLTRTGVDEIHNAATGQKLATSVHGVGTGARGDRILVDDANSVKESESKPVLDDTARYMREVLPSRLNDAEKSVIINIQQRTNEGDATGTLLDAGVDYEHLMIPMEYDPDRATKTCIGCRDPRSERGELAWTERFSADAVDALKKTLGPYAWSGQFQQAPAPRGGGLFKRDWWQIWPPHNMNVKCHACEAVYDINLSKCPDCGAKNERGLQFPPMEFIMVSVDTAYTTKKENDYSACVVLGVWKDQGKLPKIMLMKAWQEKLEFHGLLEKIIETCRNKSGASVDMLLIEAKANGINLAQEIKRIVGAEEFAVHTFNPGAQDKIARAISVQHLFANEIVYAPDRKYANMVIDQMENFPKAKHDDLVDAMVNGIIYLRKLGLAMLSDEGARAVAAENAYQPKNESIADIYGV